MSYTLVKGLASHSASPTDIWLMKEEKTGQPVIAKIFVYSMNGIERDSSKLLAHEAKIYAFIKKSLRRPSFLFAVFRDYQTLTLDQLDASLTLYGLSQKLIDRNVYNNVSYMIECGEETPDKAYCKRGRAAITETKGSVSTAEALGYEYEISVWKSVNISFRYIVTNATMDGDKLGDNLNKFLARKSELNIPMISSLFFAIYCLAEIGINQNDMHWGNVLTQKIPFHFDYYFILFKGNFYTIKSNYAPVLFDYDRATRLGHSNRLMVYYEHAGNCQRFHKNRDILKAMCWLYHSLPKYTTSAPIRRYISESVDADVLERSKNCFLKRPGQTSLFCEDSYLDTVKGIEFVEKMLEQTSTPISVAEMLTDPAFISIIEEALFVGGIEAARMLIQHTREDISKVTRIVEEIYRQMREDISRVTQLVEEMDAR